MIFSNVREYLDVSRMSRTGLGVFDPKLHSASIFLIKEVETTNSHNLRNLSHFVRCFLRHFSTNFLCFLDRKQKSNQLAI